MDETNVCQRCHRGEAAYLVDSDVTLEGVRVVSQIAVCSPCALASIGLPGHKYRAITMEADHDN